MTTYTTTDTELTSIANAIRTKGGTTELLTYPDDFIVAIGQIEAGGGGNVYQDENGYIVLDDEASEGMITAIPLSVTANGTYTAAEHTAYTPITVSVAPTLQSKSKSYTPATTSQSETIVADVGYDGLSSVDITVSAMPVGTAGTPSAAKGSVSNHAVTITPTVTNTTGYITGGTKTGTAISVSAGELVSGTYTVDAGGTADVTNYASISVTAMTLPTTVATTSSGTSKATIAAPTAKRYLNIPVGYNATASYYTLNAVTAMTVPTTTAASGSGTTKLTVTPNTSTQYINIPTGYNSSAVNYKINPIPSNYIVPTGTITLSSNGAGIDIAQYATADVSVDAPTPVLQDKIVTPSESQQTITAGTGYDGLGTVTVNAIPSNYIVPTGTYTVTAGGTADVTNYANISVTSMVLPTSTSTSLSQGDRQAIISINTGTQFLNLPVGYNASEAYYEIKGASAMTLPTTTSSTSSGTLKATITPTNAVQYINIPTGYNATAANYKIDVAPESHFVITPIWNSTSGKWEPDCTWAQYAAAYDADKTIVMQGGDPTDSEVGPYVDMYEIDSSGIAYDIVWLNINNQLMIASYEFGSGGTSILSAASVYIDPSSTTATAADVPVGKYFYNAAGNYIQGTMPIMDDYVTEQGTATAGTSPNIFTWTYRKWNSGISECWGDSASGTRTTSTAWGNIYYSSTTIGGMTYPTGLFTTTPVATLDFIPTSNDAWSNITKDGSATTAPTAYVYRPNNGTVTGFCRCYARGRWQN